LWFDGRLIFDFVLFFVYAPCAVGLWACAQVARAVRQRNAAAVWEDACWARAALATGSWVVLAPVAVPLRARPQPRARATGYVLLPGARFDTAREVLALAATDTRGRRTPT